jgi:type 2 lantibiotic biosynthesis protein LanM
MPLADPDLRDIVERASSFTERLNGGFEHGDLAVEDERVEALLTHWRKLIAPGDPTTFERRLAWDGLDEAAARSSLARPRLAAGEPLPPWSITLSDAVNTFEASSEDSQRADRALDPGAPIPFEEVVLPFVVVARHKMFGEGGQASGLSSTALTMLERALLRQLAELFRLPLYFEFAVQRASRQSTFSRLLAQAAESDEHREYSAFVTRMRAGSIASFFRKFPVLARLAAQTTDRWAETSAELIHRLVQDHQAIKAAFSDGADLGEVVALGTDLSDAHQGGRSVVAVRFASGLRLIYKPRDLGLEQAYFSLLAWLNEHGAPLPFQLLRILERPQYGWVEFVENRECADEAEAERYFRRAGMLLCLVYALGGTDYHCENVVASGEQPVLVDLETILHPQPAAVADTALLGGAQFLADVRLQEGVLGTGLLPWWVTNEEGATIDMSGLGGVIEQTSIDRTARWTRVNTDQMNLIYEFITIPLSGNVVRLGGRVVSTAAYTETIVDGFRTMHAVLQRNMQVLLAADGPLKAFAGQSARFLFRDTRVYGRLLMSTLDCDSLQDGALRSIELDILSKPLLWTAAPNPFWPLRRSEQAALERLDIPYFSTPTDVNSIALEGGESLDGCFVEAPFTRACSRLQALERDDVDTLAQMIRAALHTRVAINGADEAAIGEEPNHDVRLSTDELLKHAKEISDALREQAIHSPDGSVSWIGLGYLPVAERFQLQPTGPELYGGFTGIALFLAALAQTSGDDEFGALALGALRTLRRELTDDNIAELTSWAGIGGATGCGSLVYTLVRISTFLGDPSLIDDANRLAAHISREQIATDTGLDVTSGAAGAILGLLALYDTTGEHWVLDRAIACGQHLLRSRVQTPTGHRAWRTRSVEKPLTGFAHGAAGIAYALLRLFERANDAAFTAAAIEGIAYERSLFVSSVGNWQDLRESSSVEGEVGVHRTAWCHGAPGIALARLGGLKALDTADIRTDIDIGLETTQRFGAGGFDHLCCGGMGRVEVLIEGSHRLGRPELLKAAHQQAGWTVRRAERAGGYRTQSGLGMVDPGFFSGTAGIGYTLLRLAHSESLPSVLLWE